MGVPGIVQQTLIRPPYSRIGPASDAERATVRAASPVTQKYDQTVDRESAHEILAERTQTKAREAEEQREEEEREAAAEKAERKAARSRRSSGGRRRQSVGEALAKSAARSIGSSLGRQIVRGILGAILKK